MYPDDDDMGGAEPGGFADARTLALRINHPDFPLLDGVVTAMAVMGVDDEDIVYGVLDLPSVKGKAPGMVVFAAVEEVDEIIKDLERLKVLMQQGIEQLRNSGHWIPKEMMS